MKVKFLNVKFSPNVGDGLLVECLENQFRKVDESWSISSIDLAGRTSYSYSQMHREKLMRLLEFTPSFARSKLAYAGLAAKLALKLKSHYRVQIQATDAIVLGGGNLFSDQDLNFPLKISSALKEAAEQKKRVAIYGCGVSGNWSRVGHKIVCKAISANPPISVSVRYQASKIAWDNLFYEASGVEAQVVHDPGILASSVYRFKSDSVVEKRPCVAIGVMSNLSISYHGFSSLNSTGLIRWYLNLIDEMLMCNFSVLLFTNGSPEDHAFAVEIFQRLKNHVSKDRIGFKAVSFPVDLCESISKSDVVVAFRMHAIIAAYSYGKPFAALKWDQKVEAFLEAVGMSDHVFDVIDCRPSEVAHFLSHLAKKGLDMNEVYRAMTHVENSIERLHQSLQLK